MTIPIVTRLCRSCGNEYPFTSEHFYKSKGHKYGLFTTCKTCAKAKTKVWREANPERAYNKTREWKLTNPKRNQELNLKSLNRHRFSAQRRQRELRSSNIEAARQDGRAKAATRKAHRIMAEGSYTRADLDRLCAEQEGRCSYCAISIYWQIPRDIHVDHIVPLSRGGSNWPDNLVLACADCNLGKGDKLYSEWISARGW